MLFIRFTMHVVRVFFFFFKLSIYLFPNGIKGGMCNLRHTENLDHTSYFPNAPLKYSLSADSKGRERRKHSKTDIQSN